MANQEHFEILRQGVERWNKWRENNIGIIPDLSKATLNGIDLSEIDFSDSNLSDVEFNRVNLRNANLVRANVYKANLSGSILRGALFGRAHLREANLRTADLRRADIFSTDLRGADLYRANFCEANLRGALLREANLREADFSRSMVGWTIFGCVDLSEVKGLDVVHHSGPSTLGIDTLYQSGGKIPENFLRGCGVPEQFITYLPSLAGQAIQYYSCFISYSSKDQAFAERLHADLQSKGVRCWFAPEDLKIGDKFRFRIDESIRVHEKLLLVLSENSIASDWVEKEVETAMEKERENKKTVLFPVRLDDSVNAIKSGWAADVRRTRHIGDFSNWESHDEYGKVFERLLRDLKVEASADEML